MGTNWENIVNHVGMIYGHNISNVVQKKRRIYILQPEHTHQVKYNHLKIFEWLRYQHSRLIKPREVKLQFLEGSVQRQEEEKSPVNMEMLINDIYEMTYQATVEPDIKLNENEKTQ